MAESWSERARRMDAERDERRRREEGQRRRREEERRRRRHLRKLREKLLLDRQRRELEKKLRREAYKAKKKMFGQCPTCGRANGPGHTCRMRFSERNSERLRKRMEQRGMPEHENLWKGRRAA